jgi:ABC-type transport system substrate-binding protein
MKQEDFMGARKIDALVDALDQGQISRRDFLKAAVGLGLSLPAAMGLLQACAPTPTGAPTMAPAESPVQTTAPAATSAPTEAAGAKSGGTLVFAYSSNVTNMDPARIIGQWNTLPHYIAYDGLIRLKPESGEEIEPALAESWEVSDDGLTRIFHLRKDATFHDGSPFNAEAVVFSFMRIIDPNHPFHYGDMAPPVMNFEWMENVEAIDEYTVRMTSKWPYPVADQFLCTYCGLIVCPNTFEQYGDDAFSPTHANGTGPFKLTNWIDGDRMEFARNDDYWGGKPYLDKLVVRTVPEPSTQFAELQAGSVHIVEGITHPRNIPTILANPDLQIHQLAGPIYDWLGYNLTKPVFADVRVRQAILYAIDRETIAETLYQGLEVPIIGWVPQFCKYWDSSQTLWPYDPEKAKQLLADAGYGDGLQLDCWQPSIATVDNIVGAELGTAIQGELAKVGINLKLVQVDIGTLMATLQGGVPKYPWEDLDTYIIGFGSIVADIDNTLNYLYRLYEKGGAGNYDHYVDEETSDLIDAGRQTVDTAERARIYEEIQQRLAEYVPHCPLFQGTVLYTSSSKVQGFRLFPSPSGGRWEQVWLAE